MKAKAISNLTLSLALTEIKLFYKVLQQFYLHSLEAVWFNSFLVIAIASLAIS